MPSDRTYPHVTDACQHTLLQKIRARLNRCQIRNGDSPLFLGYCRCHGYFHDYEHTNGEIRCPRCDQYWNQRHNNT